MKIVLAGGTGFIGTALRNRLLDQQHAVTLLTRAPERVKAPADSHLQAVGWDGVNVGPWASCIDGADAVINLAGETVAQRWTARSKARIIDSRLQSTRAIIAAIEQAHARPAVLINASATGYYGHVESGDVTESHPPGTGFLSFTCQQWEAEADRVRPFGVRLVILRLGVVLGGDGGALKRMLPAFKLGLGGRLGSGSQWVPWVHRDDVVEAVLFALHTAGLAGPINVVGEHPVTMTAFAAALGRALGRPAWLAVPAFVLRVVLGEMAEVVLTGQRAVPRKLLENGFAFRHANLDSALASALAGDAHCSVDTTSR